MKPCFKFWLIPAFIYSVGWIILSWPQVIHIHDRLLGSYDDTLQNYWNLWWVRYALSHHLTVWVTPILHAPYGIPLIAHPLSLPLGLLGATLFASLSVQSVYNLFVVSSFIFSGLALFGLAYCVSRTYIGSIIAGFAYTFSLFHWGQARDHLELTQMQTIPLALWLYLSWWRRPTILKSCLLSAAIILTWFTSYYYFFVLVILLVILTFGYGGFRIPLVPTLVFLVMTGSILFPHLVAFQHALTIDPVIGAHDPQLFALTPLNLLVPGKQWRWASFTEPIWVSYRGSIYENGLAFGFSGICILLLVIIWWHRLPRRETLAWLICLPVFLALSMNVPFIYHLFPWLSAGGIVQRFIIGLLLATSILLALVWPYWQRHTWLSLLVVCILILERVPLSMPLTQLSEESWVKELSQQPGIIYDVISPVQWQMYWQTIHQQPLAIGYLARKPFSRAMVDNSRRVAFETHDVFNLCHTFAVRYLVIPLTHKGEIWGEAKVLYEDTGKIIYDLSTHPYCSNNE